MIVKQIYALAMAYIDPTFIMSGISENNQKSEAAKNTSSVILYLFIKPNLEHKKYNDY